MDEIEVGGIDWVRVSPIHHKEADGSVYLQPYDFTKVYIQDVKNDGEDLGGDLTFPFDEVVGLYNYGSKEEVIITQSGAFRKKNSSRSEAENQAYFALSRLSEKGYVGRWGTK